MAEAEVVDIASGKSTPLDKSSRVSAGARDDMLALWVSALGVVVVVGGYVTTRALLRVTGHSGRAETVEWGTYLILLVALPSIALVTELLLPKLGFSLLARRIKQLLAPGIAVAIVIYLSRADILTAVVVLASAALTVGLALWRAGRLGAIRLSRVGELAMLAVAAVGSWMAAGELVSWTSPARWFLGSATRLLVLAVMVLLARFGLGDPDSGPEIGASRRTAAINTGAALALIALIALSFRTYPVLELYHWQAYVGPMEGVRQGGLLLWDVASQYGLLPILIPAALPGNGWQSFYLFQGLMNAAAAALLFITIRRLAPGWPNLALAFLVTSTTLFFRPRSASLILAGQMTPSGGPVRFIWAFVMLVFVAEFAIRSREGKASDRTFVVRGSAIWLVSLLWSVEAAVYCSAIWFPALAVHLTQSLTNGRRNGLGRVSLIGRVAIPFVIPLGMLAVTAAVITLWYRAAFGFGPDWMGYFEYALLYSGGFGALPIDPSGAVWFLLLILFALMTAIVATARNDAKDSGLVGLAGAWGGCWAIASYFVSRSHPANLLSITPFMLLAAATTLRLMKPVTVLVRRTIFVAMIPVFAVPAALTMGHPGFLSNIRAPRLAYSSFTDQIPLMERSLNELLLTAGARVDDPVVRIGDGRLMLPAWRPAAPGESHRTSRYSWLPKQYELIGGLPAARRRVYIDRSAAHLRLSGWLVDTRRPSIPRHDEQIAQLRRTHRETRRFQNDDWIVSWYELRPPSSRTK
jgi:hypothetical protein